MFTENNHVIEPYTVKMRRRACGFAREKKLSIGSGLPRRYHPGYAPEFITWLPCVKADETRRLACRR